MLTRSLRVLPAIATLLMALITQPAVAISPQAQRQCAHLQPPQTGQPGKDVVWMPTLDALTSKMLRLAKTGATDRVFDLGAGDGRIAIAAAREFGATAVGVEYDGALVKLGKCLIAAEGLQRQVSMVQADVFAYDFSTATVVTLYLLPELNLRLRPTLLSMAPGTRIVSHSWLMDDWEPDDQVSVDKANAYLWIVPARVAGTWTFARDDKSDRFTVSLDQSFQHVTGRIASGDASRPLWRSKVEGNTLTFSFADASDITMVRGTVNEDVIDAQVTRATGKTRYIGRRL